MSSHPLDAYTGTYRVTPNLQFSTGAGTTLWLAREGDVLVARFSGQPPMALAAAGADQFAGAIPYGVLRGTTVAVRFRRRAGLVVGVEVIGKDMAISGEKIATDACEATQIGPDFLELTKYHHLGPSAQMLGEPMPPLQRASDPDVPLIPLPTPDALARNVLDFHALLAGRRSLRRYAQDPLALEELAFLLWATQGVQQAGRGYTFRTVPSAGARHPFETYLLLNRVTGLTPGLYRYLALEHALQPAPTPADAAATLTAICHRQSMVAQSAVTFLWVAVTERTTWRYGQRGYRYLFLDAGHLCQNLHLAAEAIDAGACAIGAFDDDAINAFVGVDGVEQFVIYVAALGKKE